MNYIVKSAPGRSGAPFRLRVSYVRTTQGGSKMATTKPATQAAPASPKELSEFLWKVQAYISDYLRFGDTKAGFAVATVSAILGALLKAKRAPLSHVSASFFYLAAAFLIASAVLGVAAVTPPLMQLLQLFRQKKPGLMFWDSVAAQDSAKGYLEQLKMQSAEELIGAVSEHVYAVAAICRVKYILVPLCILIGFLGALFAGLFALVS
jgi:Family of unknown function (DUF5706)